MDGMQKSKVSGYDIYFDYIALSGFFKSSGWFLYDQNKLIFDVKRNGILKNHSFMYTFKSTKSIHLRKTRFVYFSRLIRAKLFDTSTLWI